MAVELTITGRSNSDHSLELEIKDLATNAKDVTLLGHISDDRLSEIFAQSHATVFASYEEGFGLPVLESLWQGLPCLCHNGSSLAEVAPGGGTLMVDMTNVDAIADGIVRLASENGLLARLSQEAVARPVRNWDTYARDVLLAMARTATRPDGRCPASRWRGGRDLCSVARSRPTIAHRGSPIVCLG